MIKVLCSIVCSLLLTGCLTPVQKEELKTYAHNKILEYVENEGKDKAIQYIDKLVQEGKMGSYNAERIKSAIPEGIIKLKEVMGEIENE